MNMVRRALPAFLALALGLIPGRTVIAQSPTDPVAELQARLLSGDSELAFDSIAGWLPAVLHELEIPASSQTLVFARTSLQTDMIDIYYLHRTDFNVPQEESLAALDYLIQQGKIRYIACSTFPPWRTVEALMLAEKYNLPKFICEQPPYNLLDRRVENEYIPMCRAYDMGIMTWSPLAHGVLAGKYKDASKLPEGSRGTLRKVFGERITKAGIAVGDKFVKEAARLRFPPAQLAVAWVLHQPGVTGTIIGPRSLEQLEEILPAVEITLSKKALSYFDKLVPPGRYVVNYFNTSGWML